VAWEELVMGCKSKMMVNYKINIPEMFQEVVQGLTTEVANKINEKVIYSLESDAVVELFSDTKTFLILLKEITEMYIESPPPRRKHLSSLVSLTVLCDLVYDKSIQKLTKLNDCKYIIYSLGEEKPYAIFQTPLAVCKFGRLARKVPYKYFVYTKSTKRWQALSEFTELD